MGVMRVLFLGGTGLTGPYAVRRLHELGHEITVFHRGEHEANFPAGVRHLHGTALPAIEPDIVIHMWAMNEADAAAFLDAYRGRAGRAIVISSGDVYRAYGRLLRLESGSPGPVPLAEDAPLRESRYPYKGKDDLYDKILVENLVTGQSRLPVTILRYPAVYGPGDQHRFARWIRAIDAGAPELKVADDFGRWRWTHGFAEDVAESIVLAATNPRAAGRVYNVGEAETPSWFERIEKIGRAAGWKGGVVPVSPADLPEAERMPLDFAHDLVFDTSRIRAELDYAEIVPQMEALERTIAWERHSAVK
jgi:nucleoside-diphosphate-sugar epimerase